MSGWPSKGVGPGGNAALSSTGSVLSAIPSGSVGVGAGSLAGPDTSGTATAVGYHALAANTAAARYGNTAFGYQAGAANTTGGITAFGYDALMTNTTAGGTGNVDEQSNSAFGMNALKRNTTGTQNTAVGGAALTTNTTGHANTAVGNMALEINLSGSNNTAVGVGALLYSSTPSGNTAIGVQSMTSMTLSGGNNTAIGFQSLGDCTTGTNNVALGQAAGQVLTTGFNNTMVGSPSGNNGAASTVAGYDNTFVGCLAGPGDSSDPNNTTAIGCQATCIGNGSVAIGRDSGGNGAAATITNQFMLGTANHIVTIPGTLNLATPPGRVAGDLYLVYDPTTHVVHLSAIGPAS